MLRGHVSQELIDISIPIGKLGLPFCKNIKNKTKNTFFIEGGDSRPDFSRRMCSVDKNYCQHPRSATTRLLILQKGFYDGFPATKVLLKPITGRRHQLRVHCSLLGHTIVGDFTYSNGKDNLPYRMFLHAHRLILPTSLENLDVCAGDPFDNNNSANCLWSPDVTVNNIGKEAYKKLDQQPAATIVTTTGHALFA